MSQQFNNQFFAYSKQFADSSFQAQALALKGFQAIADLQMKAFEKQSAASAQFVAEAMETRDVDGLRGLWEKGASLSRENAEQSVATSQEIIALSQKTAESMNALIQEQRQAANDAVAAPTAKKAAAK